MDNVKKVERNETKERRTLNIRGNYDIYSILYYIIVNNFFNSFWRAFIFCNIKRI